MVVKTDVSDYVSKGVLSQYDENDILHPIAYFSKKHSPTECNYEIYDKELMAIVQTFEEWRPELKGSISPVSIVLDHKNLEYFAVLKQFSCQQARWSKFLSRFNFQIIYCPGKAGRKPNALTCRSGDLPKVGDILNKRDIHQHQVILKPHNFVPSAQNSLKPGDTYLSSSFMQQNHCSKVFLYPAQLHLQPRLNQITPDNDPLDIPTETLWELAREKDKFAPSILKLFKDGTQYHKGIPLAECEDRDGCLYFRDRCYVSRSNRLRLRIIQQAHDSIPEGHPGRTKTYDLVTRSYLWSGMYNSIVQFVRDCHVCRRSKPSRQKYQGWLRPLLPPERRWQDVSLNYVGPLPPNTYNGVTYRYILVFVCRLSKMRHLAPASTQEVEEAAELFYQHVWKLHGLPDNLTSDRGS